MSTVITTKGTIVSAALTILRTHGPSALTVRNITDAAGCSTSGIYTHFGGKAGVIEAIFVDGFESFDAATRPGLSSGDLLTAGRAYRRWALDHPTQYMVMFGRAVPEYVPSHAAGARASATFEHLVDGVHRAEVTTDADTRRWAFHLFATLHGYLMLELSSMAVPVEDIEDHYERALTELAAPPAPRSR